MNTKWTEIKKNISGYMHSFNYLFWMNVDDFFFEKNFFSLFCFSSEKKYTDLMMEKNHHHHEYRFILVS